jgi:hypothetical protein
MRPARLAPLLLAAALAACGDDDPAPSDPVVAPPAAALDTVIVLPASLAHPGGLYVLGFDRPMAEAMARFVDLHPGDLSAPPLALTCVWAPEFASLTCFPAGALDRTVTHTLHVGAGLLDAAGARADLSRGLAQGGRWLPAASAGAHAGSLVEAPWSDEAGHAGLLFEFVPR